MDHQRKSFKVAEYISQVWITKEEVLNFRSAYMLFESLEKKFQICRFYISGGNDQRRTFKVAESIYHVWMTKAEVLQLGSLFIMYGELKQRF